MTAAPDVVDPGESVDAALDTLGRRGYRHMPVVSDAELVGIVSMRDLMKVASIRPAGEAAVDVPRGLKGVVVTETSVGDVRGTEGFFHYRQYSAVELAEHRTLEDVWALLFDGALPDEAGRDRFAEEVIPLRALPDGLDPVLRSVATNAHGAGPLDGLRTVLSAVAAAEGLKPSYDLDGPQLRADALRLAAVTPTIVAALHRLSSGLEPVAPRADLGHAANYLWMVHGTEPDPAVARAIEQYLVLTVDHGFNASTFTARVIASTGADAGAAVVGAIGALSGPLHGGAPSRALALLDAIGKPDRAPAYIRNAVEHGERIMGFGHAVYKTDDPRSTLLRSVAQSLGGPRADFAVEVEKLIVDTLAEVKPGRQLYANVEYYAGVVMEAAGLPPELFTPTFAVSRTIGWCANVLEQATDNRIIRPSARYVGPPPPQPVPQI
jgi:citrate synthase